MHHTPVKNPGPCWQSPHLPATTPDLQFPFELHKREIIGSFDRCLNHERQDGAGTADPHTPHPMTWLTLTAEREAPLHLLPICLRLSAHQSNKSSIQGTNINSCQAGLLRTQSKDKEFKQGIVTLLILGTNSWVHCVYLRQKKTL